jgi:hypothetical protein
MAPLDMIFGVDYKHVWLNAKGDLDFNGSLHTLNTTSDMVTARLTLKLNPWGGGAVVAKY